MKKTLVSRYNIVGCDDSGEAFSLRFTAPDPNPRTVFLYAIEALWAARYTPGSISWKVYQNDHDLKIGENF